MVPIYIYTHTFINMHPFNPCCLIVHPLQPTPGRRMLFNCFKKVLEVRCKPRGICPNRVAPLPLWDCLKLKIITIIIIIIPTKWGERATFVKLPLYFTSIYRYLPLPWNLRLRENVACREMPKAEGNLEPQTWTRGLGNIIFFPDGDGSKLCYPSLVFKPDWLANVSSSPVLSRSHKKYHPIPAYWVRNIPKQLCRSPH